MQDEIYDAEMPCSRNRVELENSPKQGKECDTRITVFVW